MHIEWTILRPQLHCNYEMHSPISLPIDVSKCHFEAHIENELENILFGPTIQNNQNTCLADPSKFTSEECSG